MRQNGSGVGVLMAVSLVSCVLLGYAAFPALYYMQWVLVVPSFALVCLGIGLARGLTGGKVLDLWSVAAGFLVVVTLGAVALKLPMRIGVLLAIPELNRVVAGEPLERAGPYFLAGAGPDYCGSPEVVVVLLDGPGDLPGLVHAPFGFDGSCFNLGSAGHLVGDWYFKVED